MNLIDTHAHICDQAFEDDLRDVLEKCASAGVTGIVAVSETLEDARRNLVLASEHACVLPAAGLYPAYTDLEAADAMEEWIRRHHTELVAIGEVGLDRWQVKEPEAREVQEEIFVRFIRLAGQMDLPLNVHSRSAGKRTVEILLANGATMVQLHAFDGKVSAAMPALEAGFLFSIPPSVVRSRQKQKLVRRLPLESLLVESDSPVLGPVPGVRNEPVNITVVIDAIAGIKGISREEVCRTVAENTARLYQVLVPPDEIGLSGKRRT